MNLWAKAKHNNAGENTDGTSSIFSNTSIPIIVTENALSTQ
jgi:hypothetical protein